MFYIAVCDSDRSIFNEIKESLEYRIDAGRVAIAEYACAEDLLDDMSDGVCFDMIFLSVEQKGVSGILAGHIIRFELDDQTTHIVCMASDLDHAIQLFDIRPMNFLLKPVKGDKFIAAVETAMKLSAKYGGSYCLRGGKSSKFLKYRDIDLFESVGRKILVHIGTDTREEYRKLDEIEDDVPDSFIRIHKSYLINIEYIQSWKSDSVTLISGRELPVSKSHRRILKKVLIEKSGR